LCQGSFPAFIERHGYFARIHSSESGAFPKGVSGPALRALHGAGVRSLEDLTGWTEADLGRLHGMGPKALVVLRAALDAEGLQFRKL
jgi:hypothetical protein